MKNSFDFLVLPSVMFGIFGLYNIFRQNKKITTLENDIETIMKTHLNYMEVQEKQQEAIKDLYDLIEGVAITLPFSNKHEWQNRMIQRRFNRELDRYTVDEERKKMENEEITQRVYEEERLKEEKRRMKTERQIKRVIDNEDIPQTKFYDNE